MIVESYYKRLYYSYLRLIELNFIHPEKKLSLNDRLHVDEK